MYIICINRYETQKVVDNYFDDSINLKIATNNLNKGDLFDAWNYLI